jgi:hypothetical protein
MAAAAAAAAAAAQFIPSTLHLMVQIGGMRAVLA